MKHENKQKKSESNSVYANRKDSPRRFVRRKVNSICFPYLETLATNVEVNLQNLSNVRIVRDSCIMGMLLYGIEDNIVS